MLPLSESFGLSGFHKHSGKITIIFVLFTIFLFSQPVEAKYGGGSGTADDPYQIASAYDLIALGESPEDYDKHFILIDDIDMDPNLPSGRIFDSAVIAPSIIVPKIIVVVGCSPFKGDFDGNGHTIRNLFIEAIEAEGEWAEYIGLFGCIEGHVRNTRLENINISGSYKVGGLTGSNQGTITACSVSGSITGQTEVGTVAGINYGTISSCHAAGEVWADSKVGGLVGYHTAGTIAFSYSITHIGGNYDVGGLIGASQEGTVYLSYWDIDTSSAKASAGGRGKHSAEMMGHQTYRGWGYPKVWTIDEGLDYPRLLWEETPGQPIMDEPCSYGGGTGEPNDPSQIWSAEQLISIGYCPDDLNDHFVLMDDIDLSDIDPNQIVPIGTARWPFEGVFDGNGYVISNLVLELYGQSCVGLFGCLERQQCYPSPDHEYRICPISGIVKNVHLANATVIGGNLTGALVGLNQEQVLSCSATGVVHGQNQTGGLVGHNKRIVDDCHYAGNVEGEANVGGLCGHNSWGDRSFVKSSSASGTVIGVENVGGLVGFNEGYRSGVFSCHASSDVFAADSVGGLVGHNNNSIQESYSTGNVTGQTEVGGLVGYNFGEILNCYATGVVHGSEDVAGLVGINYETILSCYTSCIVSGERNIAGLAAESRWGEITSCFWDSDISGLTDGVADQDPDPEGILGLSTAQMQVSTTFINAGWDFVGETENGTEDIWWILEGQDYPHLSWELAEEQ